MIGALLIGKAPLHLVPFRDIHLFCGKADGGKGQDESGRVDNGGQAAIVMDLETAESHQPWLWFQQQAGVEDVQEATVAT